MLRLIRITGVGTVLAFLFRISQQLIEARGEEQVAGYSIALAIVSLLFLIRAAVTEYAVKEAGVVQKDVLWGLSLGTFVALLARLSR